MAPGYGGEALRGMGKNGADKFPIMCNAAPGGSGRQGMGSYRQSNAGVICALINRENARIGCADCRADTAVQILVVSRITNCLGDAG